MIQFIAAALRTAGETEVARLCAGFEDYLDEYRRLRVTGQDGNITHVSSAL